MSFFDLFLVLSLLPLRQPVQAYQDLVIFYELEHVLGDFFTPCFLHDLFSSFRVFQVHPHEVNMKQLNLDFSTVLQANPVGEHFTACSF